MLTLKEIYDSIRATLGIGAVEVELSNEHLLECVRQALEVLNDYSPRSISQQLPHQNGGRYIFTDSKAVHDAIEGSVYIPGLISIVDLPGVRATAIDADENRVDLLDPLFYFNAYNRQNVPGYRQGLEYLQSSREIFSTSAEWKGQWTYDETVEKRVYELYVALRTSSRLLYGYEALVRLEASDSNVHNGIGLVHPSKYAFVKDYARAVAKVILGGIRGKFGGIPSPDGADMALDADRLISEGNNEKETLRSGIISQTSSFPPVIC